MNSVYLLIGVVNIAGTICAMQHTKPLGRAVSFVTRVQDVHRQAPVEKDTCAEEHGSTVSEALHIAAAFDSLNQDDGGAYKAESPIRRPVAINVTPDALLPRPDDELSAKKTELRATVDWPDVRSSALAQLKKEIDGSAYLGAKGADWLACLERLECGIEKKCIVASDGNGIVASIVADVIDRSVDYAYLNEILMFVMQRGMMTQRRAIIQALVDLRAQVDGAHNAHFLPLSAAACMFLEKDQENIICHLLERGASPTASPRRGPHEGRTALMEVARRASNPNSPRLVDILVEGGASVNQSDLDGKTALHHAAPFAESSHARELMARLVHYQADPHVPDTPRNVHIPPTSPRQIVTNMPPSPHRDAILALFGV